MQCNKPAYSKSNVIKNLARVSVAAATLRVHRCDKASVMKYATKYKLSAQPSTTQAEVVVSSIQNNNNNAYYVSLSSGEVNNNNNKNNSFAVRAHDKDALYHISLESLIEAECDCAKNKRSKNECVRFHYKREEYLVQLQHDIEMGAYKPQPSLAFVVDYPTHREVFAARYVDRVIHHWIAIRLEPLMENHFMDTSYNCRKGRGTSYGIEVTYAEMKRISENFTRPAYLLKWDFSGYFMSIKKDVLWEMLLELINNEYHGDDKEVLIYLTHETLFNEPQHNCIRTSPRSKWQKYIPNEKSLFYADPNIGIPIGNLTSQLFANFYMWKVDDLISNLFMHYSRYVDDGWIIDIDPKTMLSFFKRLKYILKPYGIHLHKRKFYFQPVSHGLDIIGCVLKPFRIYVNNRTRSKAIKTIGYLNTLPPTTKNATKIRDSINSYLGTMKHYRSYNLRKELSQVLDMEKWKKKLAFNQNITKVKLLKYYRVICTPDMPVGYSSGCRYRHYSINKKRKRLEK